MVIDLLMIIGYQSPKIMESEYPPNIIIFQEMQYTMYSMNIFAKQYTIRQYIILEQMAPYTQTMGVYTTPVPYQHSHYVIYH